MNNTLSFRVCSVNISLEKGTIKKPVKQIQINQSGVLGDAHAGDWHRQVSLLGIESMAKSSKLSGREIQFGEFAENITTEGLELYHATIGDKFKIGTVELEITQIGKECHGNTCAIFKEIGSCVMPKEGIFCKVLQGGTINPGDVIEYCPTYFRIGVITLSDRASRGEYEDKSGPRLKELCENHFNHLGWNYKFFQYLIPDDVLLLKDLLKKFISENYDFIFTTGGTGVGKKDISVDVVKSMNFKEIPGIMDAVRMKFGLQNANALLSRSVAGIIENTVIYTLPGSVKAVEEYMSELIISLEHLVYMIKGIDKHHK